MATSRKPTESTGREDAQPASQLHRAGVWQHRLRLFGHFFARDLKNRFLGSFSGGLWALIQPLIMLAIYAFVFVHIFKARVVGAGDLTDYVPFLVVAMWPWTAFSEAIQRSATTITENAELIGKVAMPRVIPVLATVAASFALHTAGFVAITLVLPLADYEVHFAWLVPALGLQVVLLVLALGFSLLAAAIQVFIRDLVQILTQLLMLAMFAAPIFYSRGMIPEQFRGYIDLHPFTWYAGAYRDMLLQGHWPAMGGFVWVAVTAVITALVGWWVFHRLDPHFEDYL